MLVPLMMSLVRTFSSRSLPKRKLMQQLRHQPLLSLEETLHFNRLLRFYIFLPTSQLAHSSRLFLIEALHESVQYT